LAAGVVHALVHAPVAEEENANVSVLQACRQGRQALLQRLAVREDDGNRFFAVGSK